MEKSLSVIVPCYNVEDYIENTLNCLLNQTYKNIEIICIDDGSKDKTYDILKKYDKKISVYRNKKNMGAAYSRNFGIKKSSSEYIGFIDADDKIDYNYYEILMKKQTESNADVVVTDILSIDGENEYYSKCCNGECNKINLLNCGMAASSCNKVFLKQLLIENSFLEGKINEDVATIIPIIVKAKSIAYTDETKYYYIQRKKSVQHRKNSKEKLQLFDSVEICLKSIRLEKDFEEYKQLILYHQLAMLYFFILSKEPNLFLKFYLLNLFMKKQKKYDLYHNKYFKQFLENANENDRKYYSRLIEELKYNNANRLNFENFVDYLIFKKRELVYKTKHSLLKIKDYLKNILKKSVIKNIIDISDIEKLAKKQSKMSDNEIKVSVVVPNYNYEKFLYQRIYSILNQNYKLYEIIILDDCSSDSSRILIDQIYNKINNFIKIKKIYNEKNTGSAFKQWKKGFDLAEGDYVWIAEADDYCKNTLLEKLIEPIKLNKDKKIYISYADTAFINEKGKIFVDTIKPNIDLRNTKHWNNNFVNLGHYEIDNYAFLNCTIANVSSCIIKNESYDDIFFKASQYKQAGDWVFYVYVMNKGYISFVNKVLNYYRVHGNNITSNMEKRKHLEEIKRIHSEMQNLIEIKPWHKQEFEKRYNFLIEAWGINEEEQNKK